MPDLIILRLHPNEPMSGSNFRTLLNGLTITACDLSFAESVEGDDIGSAQGLADPHTDDPTDDSVDITATAILQHYRNRPPSFPAPPGTEIRLLEAAATAVIIVNPPPGHHEYPSANSFDIRLKLRRGGTDILDRVFDYNVQVTSVGALSNDQTVYFGMGASAFVALPPAGAGLTLPANGQPPNFDDLVTAINLVLAEDPNGATSNPDLAHLSPLTAAQSRQVAAEIIWNRTLFPPPPLPRPLGDMYTRPPVNPDIKDEEIDKAEQDRKKFEGELIAYHATHDADATRLAGFVFAASAAVVCENLSTTATRAGLTFPISAGVTTGTIPEATVILADPVALNPAFTVPAAYFYALGAQLPFQVSPEQRFKMAQLESEQRLLDEFQAAIDVRVIVVSAAPAVQSAQAARRLRALGTTTPSLPVVDLVPPVTVLVGHWLDHAGPTATIEADFWAGGTNEIAAQPAAYLELVLHAVTKNHGLLINAIKGPPHNVAGVAGLVAITDQQWRDFFLSASPPPGDPPRLSLLPPFTKPGTAAERVEAFIRHLRKFFAVPFGPNVPQTLNGGGPPTLGRSISDPLVDFINAYNSRSPTDFEFGATAIEADFQAALNDVFPDDSAARAWLEQALRTINELYLLADVGESDEVRFSIAEALYALGFTSRETVGALNLNDFREALIGTVAHEHAAAIHGNAEGEELPGEPGGEGFQPVNPDGTLTNCIPPPHLSPLGPVAYLHEMIKVSEGSTCGEPFPPLGPVIVEGEIVSGRNINDHMHGRCKSPGELLVTRANLETPLPLIDLVNECLEAVTAALPAHPTDVYNTASDELGGHKLRPLGANGGAANEEAEFRHDPVVLFEALPEHSSPSTPVKKAVAYDKLKAGFSSPLLPYSQPLDICRSYLRQLRTNRYAAMRRFRKDITELVLDPANEPDKFQRHLWRYPVRIEIAREYLGITPEEYGLLFTQDIAEETPTPDQLLLRELYGFDVDIVDGESWVEIVIKLSEFLPRTGLTYCEFIDLWKAEFVTFRRAGEDPVFPNCEPCCLPEIQIQFEDPEEPLQALKRLAVFIRLWRKLQHVEGAKYSFSQLRDICDVLHLFNDDGTINPDFIRQLAGFQMLRDRFALALTDEADSNQGTNGADRTHVLALWVGKTARKWAWAVDALLDGIQYYAQARHQCGCRPPEFVELLAENLDPLSRLAGFDPDRDGDTWHARPTHTLRFAEVLAKIYASDFGVGEVLFLFTVDEHLGGDDPFPLQPRNEALDSPLSLPDDEACYSLWALRGKLLAVSLTEEDVHLWTWTRIEASLRDEFGFTATGDPDPLLSLGEHFFPTILESCGCQVDPLKRQYRVDLADTPAPMWNTPPNGPFRYDSVGKKLWTQLPLTDEAVLAKLSRIRQLKPDEQRAVQDLYFLPRVDLATFSFIFTNFGEAEERLIQERDEQKRWAYFQREFARCYARCCIIAEHLAQHVTAITGQTTCEGKGLAWRLLKHLFADENIAKAAWESDTGEIPEVTWKPQPQGGAFAALLGLTGTGLLGEFIPEDEQHKLIWEDDTLHWEKSALAWREVRGPMEAFGPEENAWNSPIPTVLPSMSFEISQDQLRFVGVRNGFALSNADGAMLGGAQGFAVRWKGVLLVEHEGTYTFRAGAPTPEGEEPDFEAAEDRWWRVTLKRGHGQRTWILLSHHWPDTQAPAACSAPVPLKCGAYQLIVEFIQPHPAFSKREDVCPQTTGFQVKYSGADSGDCIVTVPLDKLFRDRKDDTLAAEIDPISDAAKRFLEIHFTSTLRDIRRTYQRAFKALLFAHRFYLSAKPMADDGESEIGYMLTHFEDFAGTSYFRDPPATSTFSVHKAHFDFNFLPLLDNYLPPTPDQDQRVQPTAKRQQALFDWWERVFDYTALRREAQTAPEHPVWFLFHEAAEKHPDDPAHLLRHMGVDLRHAALELLYYLGYSVSSEDLEDERWAIRAWQAEKWIRALLRAFLVKDIRDARPDLWASDDPSLIEDDETQSGNENLTKFVRDGCFENGEPRRYEDVKRLNDGLRERARCALLAYLCGMNRVALPWGGFATRPKHLSELLLLDVEAGLCQRASRIEEAISSIQAYIQRNRLGLEASFMLSLEFLLLWDSRFGTYLVWEACKRREIYRENWIDWDELQEARRTEAFRFLELELRRAALTVPVPGGLEYWPDQRPPIHPGLTVLQAREPALIQQLARPTEGFDLLGTPERHARPSWLAALRGESVLDSPELEQPLPSKRLPFWVQAAIRLGVRFLRVAAASEPPASTSFEPGRPGEEMGCCVECGKPHPAVVDEYYFWLMDSRYYNKVVQDADWGKTTDPEDSNLDNPESDWHREEELPGLLHWSAKPMTHLAWCRFHNGEFRQPRRSFEGVRIRDNAEPELRFLGRAGDSLTFSVEGGEAPPGYPAEPDPGFRYDLATDSAVVLPLVIPSPAPAAGTFPGNLPAYPYFAYFAPGAPLVPLSLFSPAVLVAGRLRAHCRFEAALKWYELVFSPLQEDSRWCRQRPTEGSPVELFSPEGEETVCCQSGSVSDPVAKDRSIILHYLETLLQWGDAVMRRNSPEAFQQARLIFDTAAKILGVPPHSVIEVDPVLEPKTVADFDPLPAPLNPRLLALYELVEDRLALIHNCLNARRLRNGRPNKDMPYWGNRPAHAGWQPNLQFCSGDESTPEICAEEDCCCPYNPYRFQFLVQKALDLANDVRSFGAALLAAYEKGDAEYLASLRATHERQLLNLALEIRQNQWREADWQVQALQKTKEIAQTRKRYNETLILNGLNSGETQYVALTGVSIGARTAANISEGIAQGMGVVPDMWIGIAGIAGTPLQFNQLPLGNKLAYVFATIARISNGLAEIANTTGSLRLTEGGWDRREDEWRHQVEVLGIEIEQIERQILGAERRRDIALRELNNHQRQIEHAAEVHDFLRDKFTNHALYLYLQQETAALHYQMFELAEHTARQAQRAFNYERGHTVRIFLPTELWDNLHEGLLAGERLQLAVRQMEKAYLCENVREYELTKHMSLRLHFPVEFLQLKVTGYCEIEIPEWMFDLDYPGHYMRRIKNVTMTIPCVVGPYTGVHCRLTLLSSTTRVDPRLSEPPGGCCEPVQKKGPVPLDVCCREIVTPEVNMDCGRTGDGYLAALDDPRIVKQYAATEAIATSTGQNDSGMFELNFRDERYLPFEFAGAISRWRIELPPENNSFDMETLSDVVLHLNFTAREGGDVLRRVANKIAQQNLPGAGLRFFDIKQEFPEVWQRFHGCFDDEQAPKLLVLRLGRNMFPFLRCHRDLSIVRIELLFEAAGAIPSAHHTVKFIVNDGRAYLKKKWDECDMINIDCVASADWPCLYHGVLIVPLGPLCGSEPIELGTFMFPCDVGVVPHVYLICGYEVTRVHPEARLAMP